MANETKLPITKKAAEPAFAGEVWRPFESLRKEVDRLFEDFGGDLWGRPFRSLARLEQNVAKQIAAPAVDVTETDKAYEITAELPGMDEKNVEVNLANGGLIIKGKKKEEKEETKMDYYVSERRYGSFERFFGLPDGVDADKIEATFKNGVLKVTLPKTPEAQQPAKKIEVKSS
ncbi:MAG: Hsp20/alpha crystallin family protein [Bradyrhizobium sp.]|uniref:Hsp20/alpha crystallin family protein n=1 Tax=Bradyrhizobium sp. TaxID=376 RepID=UPI0025C37FE6|nr:Hsp20/alpha crystallin family protein [Bradyrhizobium sp.]MBI5265091.1 Hsp20/alpha crystallin family protein [Bradyrhizobium sp.]